MIEIDGSIGEAGGQILRTACALSVVTKKPCHVFNIRKGREKPGLIPQHLLGIQALAQLCNGKLEGDTLGSEEIKFYPGETVAKDLHIRIDTADSVTLCLQSLLPPALFAPAPIRILFKGGGTDVPFSPTLDYFRFVFLKVLEKMGGKIEINVLRRGYYPEGGAQVEIKIYPSKLKFLNLTERGQFKKILIVSGAASVLKDKKVAERQARATKEILAPLKLPIEEKIEYCQANNPGSQICLIAEFTATILGADNLGKLGKSAEQVGRECALQLLEEEKMKACLDRFLGDQILVYLALAKRESQVKISQLTSHAQTNIWASEKFIPGKFEIRDNLITWNPKKI